mmetsp:Transcript_32570/g.24072  ORF Transcript_32570/g.24072 Transcript_32570/m.24072 type:complete len:153 (+) Transcript_32570:128-586(+)|eukprot:CAMPEP_0202976856 /NCGR_PEP_ID=MMETSP1396-20130829/81132_1 /ASSEMBLY_ACC=CAM_ASM_000872 /TAXON_ID= /ORGANISM="Pseudokeronopsis sp., Strain Brazil" /LENGTH=152 /DNA_ID=CAMNT_0049714931 /DNA_START=104 /DNA_END=562 /DNA_ORIENTATION=+
MSAEDESLSALRENIERKGSNSYYYAHGKKIDGPQWDGKEEPRLLSVAEGPVIPRINYIEFPSFSWLDDTRSVKIFVDFENAMDTPDTDISLVLEGGKLEFKVTRDGRTYALLIDPLHGTVASTSYRKKSDKFTIILKKEDDSSWHQLKRTT